jgi:hypothetical protein
LKPPTLNQNSQSYIGAAGEFENALMTPFLQPATFRTSKPLSAGAFSSSFHRCKFGKDAKRIGLLGEHQGLQRKSPGIPGRHANTNKVL